MSKLIVCSVSYLVLFYEESCFRSKRRLGVKVKEVYGVTSLVDRKVLHDERLVKYIRRLQNVDIPLIVLRIPTVW